MSLAAPLGTTFTYQGRLDDDGAPATGRYDFRFLLHDASFGGSQRGQAVTNLGTLVTGGLFTSPLDFGTNFFAGDERWLEIHVRTNGSGAFAALSPRQPLTSVPYSLYSTAAGFAASAVSANTASSATIAATANVANNVPWTGLTGVPGGFADGIDNDTTYTAGPGVTLSGSNQFNVDFGNSGVANLAARSDHAHSGADINSGTVNDARLSANVALLSAHQTFTGSNTFSGVILMTNLSNTVAGVFSGNGAGVTALNPANLSSGTANIDINGQAAAAVSAKNFSDNLAGDVTGSQGATVVASVGGQLAVNIAAGAAAANAASSGSLANTIVKRDTSGNFAAGAITATTFSGGGAGMTSLNASQLTSGIVPDGRLAGNAARTNQVWLLGGNGGTVPGANFLGTTDNQPLEIKVNGLRALRLEDNGDSSYDFDTIPDGAPNMIGGSPGNFVGANVVGATISGGGAINHNSLASTNSVLADFGVVGGGRDNKIAASSRAASIAGGAGNTIATNSSGSAIGGGEGNGIADHSANSTIVGGFGNEIGTQSFQSTIGGGAYNTVATSGSGSHAAVIAGGLSNGIGSDAYESAIGGGLDNNIADNSRDSMIAGGEHNRIATNSGACVIGGGGNNTISPNSTYATIPGGRLNAATNYAFAAGRRAKANHNGAFVWADSQNADFASTANDQFLIRASGGVGFNTANLLGRVTAIYSRSGSFNDSIGYFENSNVGAGTSPAMRVIVNGNAPEGALSVSTQGTGLIARFGNADVFVSALSTNGTWTGLAFNPTSDRNAKENFAPVNSREVLDKVVALPVSRWNYKAAPGLEHIGPVAQDFHAAFGLNGTDDKHIATVDSDGVALAAIQGLNEKLEEQLKLQRFKLEAKDAQIKLLNERLDRLEKMLSGLSQEGEP